MPFLSFGALVNRGARYRRVAPFRLREPDVSCHGNPTTLESLQVNGFSRDSGVFRCGRGVFPCGSGTFPCNGNAPPCGRRPLVTRGMPFQVPSCDRRPFVTQEMPSQVSNCEKRPFFTRGMPFQIPSCDRRPLVTREMPSQAPNCDRWPFVTDKPRFGPATRDEGLPYIQWMRLSS